MNKLVYSLIAVTAVAAVPADAARAQEQDPILRVSLNKRDFVQRGEKVRVNVRTAMDGYLVVLHAEPDGRVRVLFPLDPFDDNFVRGGKEYEIRSRGDREAIRVYQTEGLGTVYAAFSRDPFRFTDYARNQHWDYLLDVWQAGEDAEAQLTEVMQRWALGGFDYDLVQYEVGQALADVRYRYRYQDPYYASSYYYGSGLRFSLGFHFGGHHRFHRPYYGSVFYYSRCGSVYYYDPYYYGSYYCSPFYVSRYRHGYGAYYDPFYYDPFYYGFGHRGHVRTVYVQYPRVRVYPTQRFPVDHRYTFKTPGQQGGPFRDGIGMRDRRSPENVTTRRTLGAPARVPAAGGATGAPGRRTVEPARPSDGGRRVAPDAGRRVTPGTPAQPDGGRRVTPNQPTDERRVRPGTPAQPDAGRRVQPERGRRVQPAGWGITDGRRVVQPRDYDATPTPVTPQTPRTGGDDRVESGRRVVTPEAQPRDGARRVSPDAGRLVPGRSREPARRVAPVTSGSERRVVTPRAPEPRAAEPVRARPPEARAVREPRAVTPTPQARPAPAPRAVPSDGSRRRPQARRVQSARRVQPTRTPQRSAHRTPRLSAPSLQFRAPNRSGTPRRSFSMPRSPSRFVAPRSAPRAPSVRSAPTRSAPKARRPSRSSSRRKP